MKIKLSFLFCSQCLVWFLFFPKPSHTLSKFPLEKLLESFHLHSEPYRESQMVEDGEKKDDYIYSTILQQRE